MKIGSVFDQTSTTEFVAMLNQEVDGERLLFSYVELSPNADVQPEPDGERIIARITSIHKENPLLSRDQAGVSASLEIEGLGFEFSRRFTYGWAQCTVIGTLIHGRLDMNRRVVAPNAEVYTPSPETLKQLFFSPEPASVPLGAIETFQGADIEEVPVTLDADQLVTKHFCVFGMTGSGKTNTSAKLLEELMARGHRMIIFDSHDDYKNLENLTNLFKDTANGLPKQLKCRVGNRNCEAVQLVGTRLNRNVFGTSRPLNEHICERLLQTSSVIYENMPARQILRHQCREVTPQLVSALSSTPPWSSLISIQQVADLRAFPEIKYYGKNFGDFTITLLQAFQGEMFSPAQWRCLYTYINQQGTGLDYLENLRVAISNDKSARQDTRDVLQQMISGLKAAYLDALRAGTTALDLEAFFQRVATEKGDSQVVYRLSLTDLTSNVRKAMVYGVVTYFFRSFKFGGYRVKPRENQQIAHPILFVLEEARALIPKSAGIQDEDVSAVFARKALRELAYEGRKFSLGFGLISQKPSTVDHEVVSQANTFILHQLKSPDDQEYVRSVTEGMSLEELEMVKSLGTGRAIVAGTAVRSPVLLRVYQRHSEEGIEEPTPIKDQLKSINPIREQLGIATKGSS